MGQVGEEPIRIVINYRRRDAAGEAGHLYADLAARFGTDCVFRDIENIQPGRDFKKVIKDAIAASDVLVALIGRGWITAVDDEGNRRLHQDDDQLRTELELAMRRDVRVVPVLVQGALMPQARDVPATLKKFPLLHALEIAERRWRDDVGELIELLEGVAGEKARRLAAAGGATLEEERTRKQAFDHARHTADALLLQSLREDVEKRRLREHDLRGQLAVQEGQRRRWKVGAFAAAGAALAVSVLALVVPGGSGGGVTDKTVIVPGRDMWTDTGIDLAKGDRVTIVASGTIDTHQPDPARRSGPEGKPGEVDVGANIVRDIGHGALIRRIGAATPTGVGASTQFTAESDGRLLLGVNDWNFETNAGAFTVHVTAG